MITCVGPVIFGRVWSAADVISMVPGTGHCLVVSPGVGLPASRHTTSSLCVKG